jgi:hypothetical protein
MKNHLSSVRRWRLVWLAVALPAVLAAVLLGYGGDSEQFAASARAQSSPLFGTLDTQKSTVKAELRAGISVAMFELNWASFEPKEGVFSASYRATMRSYLKTFRAAGMRVTLGLGLQDPPSWVFSLPDSTYVNQDGDVSSEADFVFSESVRQAAASYLTQVAADLPLSDFWAIRLTSGGDAEMLYPPGGTYWAFNKAALTGVGLPPTMTPNPFPNWLPGRLGLSAALINYWVNWYVGGLDDVTNWQMHVLSGLGFSGYYQLVTPGSGTRPDVLSAEEQSDLPDGTTGVGAVWNRYYAMLPDKTNVMAYISSVADGSGDDDSCQPADNSLPLTSIRMDSWSATRWISRIAAAEGLLVAGENAGYRLPVSLDSRYTNTSSSGMMADAIRQAISCKFQVFYWAHDINLWNGTIPFPLYASYIKAGLTDEARRHSTQHVMGLNNSKSSHYRSAMLGLRRSCIAFAFGATRLLSSRRKATSSVAWWKR